MDPPPHPNGGGGDGGQRRGVQVHQNLPASDLRTCGIVGRVDLLRLYMVDLFSLEILVEGFLTVDPMGRKVYSKGRVIKWDVEMGSFSLELLMTSLQNEVKWAPTQSATVWFYHKRLGEDIRLTEEFQLHQMFEMYESEMCCHVVVAILDNTKISEVVLTDELEPLCVVPPTDGVPANPTGVSASKVANSEEPTAKEADVLFTDLFDNEEEYVGADDEHIYMPVPPTSAVDTENVSAKPTSQPSAQAPESSHANTTACPEFNENGPAAKDENGSAAKGGLPLEADVNDADPHEFNVIMILNIQISGKVPCFL